MLVRAATDEHGWMCFERGDVAIAGNIGTEPYAIPMSQPAREILLASMGVDVRAAEPWIVLPPDAVAVVRLDATA